MIGLGWAHGDFKMKDRASAVVIVTVRLVVGEHSELVKLAVTDLGSHGLFPGHDWLKKHNPTID